MSRNGLFRPQKRITSPKWLVSMCTTSFYETIFIDVGIVYKVCPTGEPWLTFNL